MTRSGDKATMARPFQGRAEMGMVSFPDTPQGRAIVEQIVSFPAGKHDDKVDACALLGRALSRTHPAIASTPEPERRRDRDYGFEHDDDVISWKVA